MREFFPILPLYLTERVLSDIAKNAASIAYRPIRSPPTSGLRSLSQLQLGNPTVQLINIYTDTATHHDENPLRI
jgi:hypothetical protein